jgi:hypothetical protein
MDSYVGRKGERPCLRGAINLEGHHVTRKVQDETRRGILVPLFSNFL